VNFEVGALEKWIKLKGTEGPHVSHHGVFRPCAPTVAVGPPPLPVSTAPPCPTPPRAPTAAALILSALSAKPHLLSSSARDSAPHHSTFLPRHRTPPLSLLALLPCRRSFAHHTARQVADCLGIASSSPHRRSLSASDQLSTRSQSHLLSTVNTSMPLPAALRGRRRRHELRLIRAHLVDPPSTPTATGWHPSSVPLLDRRAPSWSGPFGESPAPISPQISLSPLLHALDVAAPPSRAAPRQEFGRPPPPLSSPWAANRSRAGPSNWAK
jgi:hypothetical protein